MLVAFKPSVAPRWPATPPSKMAVTDLLSLQGPAGKIGRKIISKLLTEYVTVRRSFQ